MISFQVRKENQLLMCCQKSSTTSLWSASKLWGLTVEAKKLRLIIEVIVILLQCKINMIIAIISIIIFIKYWFLFDIIIQLLLFYNLIK